MKHLSKSQYARGMQCHRSLWLYREFKELQDPVSPEDQAIFDQGTEVGILAQKWIKGGVLIDAPHTEPERALRQTQDAITAGAKVLYEAAFLHDDVLVRVDILMRNHEGGWDFYEVKSTTEVKDVFLIDVAIQRHVLHGAGLKVHVAHVVHLDPAYVRYGALNLDKLFAVVDVTAETEPILANVPAQLFAMKATAGLPAEPHIAIGPHCTRPYTCSFKGHCWESIPKYSVFNLAGARMDKKTALWNAGHQTIAEIPDAEKLTAYQTVQRFVARTKEAYIKAEGVRELLNTLAYPQHFLDFEAINQAIPPYDGLRPYQQLPFEASLHTRKKRGGPLEHHEYLADGTKDPRPDLVAFLNQHIRPAGSVIAYNKSYEGGILKALAAHYDGTAKDSALLSAERRLWDLADPFRKAFYAHPAFHGSWSIKKVLPVLIPDMTYAGLAIADGVAAMQAYARLMTDRTLTPAQRAQIMADLRAYCGQDTLAMVRILDHVEATVGVPA